MRLTTIEHVRDDRAVIREIHRILKPQGSLILTVPRMLALHGLGRRLVRWVKNRAWVLHTTHLGKYTYCSVKRPVDSYFENRHWYSAPFAIEPFLKMPYEKLLSLLATFPILKQFSVSIATILKRR